MNNNVEYEALILGLKLVIDMKYEHLMIYGDSLLIFNQINRIYTCNQSFLKQYKAMVEKMLEFFKAYEIESTPRSSNRFIDTMDSLGYLVP